jgi:HlyD family secretion protein
MTAQVVRGDISVSISGSGTVAPIARYDIIPLVRGNILSAPFEEGMQVKEGDLLYRIDDSDMLINIEKTRNSIEQLNLNHKSTLEDIKNLIVYAPCDGRITDFSLREGDQTGAGTIANIIDDSKLIATVSFNASQIDKIWVGQDAQIVIPQYMMYINGKIAYKSVSGRPSPEGTILYDVEIHAGNPGAITNGVSATGVIKSSEGEIISPTMGTVEYAKEQPLRLKSSGIVSKTFVRENEVVKAGQKILELENDALISAKEKYNIDLRNLNYTLESQMKELEDYNIISPIDGVVIMKDGKAGDTVNNQSGNTILMTVADISKMEFELQVDELDISKIQVGQKATIEADALPRQSFEGSVTNVSLEGSSQSGVTTYTVQITVDEPGELKPGMNVNAEIMVQHKSNVLYLPMAAVTMIRNDAFVYLEEADIEETERADNQQSRDEATGRKTSDEGKRPSANMTDEEREELRKRMREAMPEGEARQQGGGRMSPPERTAITTETEKDVEGRNQEGQSSIPEERSQNTRQPEIIKTEDGKFMKRVEVGINNEDFIEIVSGLEEGDTVILPYAASPMGNMPGNFNNMRMPGGGMGAPGGTMRIRR